jgi:hypothetical protein
MNRKEVIQEGKTFREIHCHFFNRIKYPKQSGYRWNWHTRYDGIDIVFKTLREATAWAKRTHIGF